MTIGNAIAFINRALVDSALRERLNSTSNAAEIQNLLREETLVFSVRDFDEAVHHRLTQCREEEEAEQIKELKMWWHLLFQSSEPAACITPCSGCCG
ncbi:MAG: Nif11-like leader peptide family natural product precursor [Desulfobacterales bacterium]|jgi:hypothetical protein|nr:Nif11-like leader peptide family natural product precursor [Desulfobacterales bacterium]